jgi:hypothetical protein
LRRNCSDLIRRVSCLVAAALLAEEAYEGLTSWHGLNPRADQLLDNLTVILTIVAVIWSLQEHYARRHADIRRRDQQVKDLSDFANVAVQRLETGEPRAAMPLRSVNGKSRLG